MRDAEEWVDCLGQSQDQAELALYKQLSGDRVGPMFKAVLDPFQGNTALWEVIDLFWDEANAKDPITKHKRGVSYLDLDSLRRLQGPYDSMTKLVCDQEAAPKEERIVTHVHGFAPQTLETAKFVSASMASAAVYYSTCFGDFFPTVCSDDPCELSFNRLKGGRKHNTIEQLNVSFFNLSRVHAIHRDHRIQYFCQPKNTVMGPNRPSNRVTIELDDDYYNSISKGNSKHVDSGLSNVMDDEPNETAETAAAAVVVAARPRRVITIRTNAKGPRTLDCETKEAFARADPLALARLATQCSLINSFNISENGLLMLGPPAEEQKVGVPATGINSANNQTPMLLEE